MIDRNELIEQYMPYVHSIANKIAKKISHSVEYDDLVGYGKIGLVEAADRFDPKRGADFKTYAYYRIRGAIYDGLRGMGWLSPSEYARFKFQRGASSFLGNFADRGITKARKSVNDEVNEVSDVVRSLAAIFVVSSEAVEGFEAADTADVRPDTKWEDRELSKALSWAIGQLPERQQTLIRSYYFDDKTLAEIGEDLGVSKSWMSRLHSRAIETLNELLSSEKGLADAAPGA